MTQSRVLERWTCGTGLIGQAGTVELDFQREFPPDYVELFLGVVDIGGGLKDVILGELDAGLDDGHLGHFGRLLGLGFLQLLQHRLSAGQLTFGLGELLLVQLVERDSARVDVEADPAVISAALDVACEGTPIASLACHNRDLDPFAVLRERRLAVDLNLHVCLLRPRR